MTPTFAIENIRLFLADSMDALPHVGLVESIVTDPPYGLSFMGRKWDYDVPTVDLWTLALECLRPGGHLLAFAGTRTQHRMAVRIEDAGFEIRDMIAWVYGSGFPKSLDVSKAIDQGQGENRERQLRFTAWMRSTGITASQINEATRSGMGLHYLTAGSQPQIATAEMMDAMRHLLPEVPEEIERLVAERTGIEWTAYVNREVVGRRTMTDTSSVRIACATSAQGIEKTPRREIAITIPATDSARQWSGWGTALKPALEPITVARRPLDGTVAETVLAHGTGALNVDECRVGMMTESEVCRSGASTQSGGWGMKPKSWKEQNRQPQGRWPSNLIHDGSEEVVGLFPHTHASHNQTRTESDNQRGVYGGGYHHEPGSQKTGYGDSGSAARFFYCAKASKQDRDEGCESLPRRSAGEMTDRSDGSDGLNSPRAGSGRGNGACNFHPTVKPTDLMRYLCRLVTRPGGIVLDPFMGSGSTGKAAVLEGFGFVGIERDPDHFEIAKARILDAIRQRDEARRLASAQLEMDL